MSKVQWGILSTAGIAQKALIPAFERSANADVAAIASGSDIKKADNIAKRFNIPKTYDSYEKLLADPDIQAVYIPLPNHLHKKWVIEAAKAGKHILCEKPAAMNTDEALEMREACEKYGVLFMEAFMYYFHPQHERVKEIIDAGEIGEVKAMRAAFSFNLPNDDKANNIRMSAEKGGGSIYDIGCYTIHSIRHILRSEPETVHAHAIIDPKYNVDTDVVAYMTFADGRRATLDVSFNMDKRSEYAVYGTEGSIVVPRAYRPDWNGGDGLVMTQKQGVTRTETLNGDQYRLQVEHMSDVILNNDETLRHDFNNTINNMRVMDACLQSIKRGDMITFN